MQNTRSSSGLDGFAVIVLAAGKSPGAGRPRQLLPYLGRTLIEHAALTALASGATQVIVVVGNGTEECAARLRKLPVKVVVNRQPEKGISSSIRAGLSLLSPDSRAAVISLCDRPGVTPGHLRSLAAKVFATGAPVVASAYDGVLGAPCAFSSSMFPSLLALRGPHGAQTLIRSANVRVEAIHFALAGIRAQIPNGFRYIPNLNNQPTGTPTCYDCLHSRAPPTDNARSLIG